MDYLLADILSLIFAIILEYHMIMYCLEKHDENKENKK